jgi:hypothetical protein
MCRRIVGLSRTMKTEALRLFEMWTIYRSTPRNITEDLNLHLPEDGHISQWLLCHKSIFIQRSAFVWLDVIVRFANLLEPVRKERANTVLRKILKGRSKGRCYLFGMKLCKIGKCLGYFTERTQTLLFIFILLSQFSKAKPINFVSILPLAWCSLTLLHTAQVPLIPDWTVNQFLVPCLTWVAELFNCSGNTPPFPGSRQEPVRKYHEKRYVTAVLRRTM